MTDRLKERLRAFDDVDMGGACEVTVYRNPDGPEALAYITQLEAALRDIATDLDDGNPGHRRAKKKARAALHQGDRKP